MAKGKKPKFYKGQVVWNKRWSRYGRVVAFGGSTYCEGRVLHTYTSYGLKGHETWVEKDCRKLKVREVGPTRKLKGER